jgi:restriction system protein
VQPIFDNRVGWARTYLKKAGVIETPRRGIMRITERGRELLGEHLERIDTKVLMRYPEFQEFQSRMSTQSPSSQYQSDETATPEEQISKLIELLRQNLADELLEKIAQCSPQFFERLVGRLFVAMGYGGGSEDAVRVVGRSGDEGIDVIINQDRLGLDVIYIQAKRWTKSNPVGRPEIQKFVGALQFKEAQKGIVITTSSFTQDAKDYAKQINKVILIDGRRLAELMIEYNVGVTTKETHYIKKIDSDFFDEE